MRTRLTRIRMRDAALFVAVAALVALVVVFAGRQAGLGERAGAGVEQAAAEPPLPTPEQESGGEEPAEPLTLSLDGPEICETLPPRGGSGGIQRRDKDGNWYIENVFLGWSGVNEIPVNWTVIGGTGPYSLEIDGVDRDALGPYQGQDGIASVNCAHTFSDVFFEPSDSPHRLYWSKPVVDSGLKTIQATVTDAAGATATASLDIYVILDGHGSGDVLKRGETYRVFDILITAPKNYDVEVGSVTQPDCGGAPSGTRCEAAFRLHLIDTGARVSLYMDGGAEGTRRYPDGAQGASGSIDAAFDELVNSVGRQPSVERNAP